MAPKAKPQSLTLALRTYQTEALAASAEAVQEGISRHLIVCPTGCHRAGQGILMHNGSVKPVEQVAVGDLLMGPDSKPRTVLELARGEAPMLKIRPVKGSPWVVNDGHILTLVRTKERNGARGSSPSTAGGGIVDISLAAWGEWSRYKKHVHKLFRVGVDFSNPEPPFQVSPYFLGLMLGDGTLADDYSVRLSKPDPEVRIAAEEESARFGLRVRVEDRATSPTYHLVGTPNHPNQLLNELRRLGVMPVQSVYRFIPFCYLTASVKTRRALLAGLLDADGSLTSGGYDFISKSKQLADDVTFLARSLGLAAYQAEKECTGFGITGTYHRVSISGDCSVLPLRIPRKQASARQQIKDVLRTGFSVESTGTVEPFYGFSLSGDGRFLLDDFTVTHNTGKTVMFAHQIKQELDRADDARALVLVHRDELVNQTIDKLDSIAPGVGVGIIKAERNDIHARVIVASIQTLANPYRLRQLTATAPFTLVIVDEAHHAVAETYNRVLTGVGSFGQKRTPTVGYTATPMRGDGVTLGETWQKIVYQKQLLQMILAGYLVDVKAKRITLDMNLDNVATNRGDFGDGALGAAMTAVKAPEAIAQAYYQFGEGRKALGFTPTVAMAYECAEAMKEHGIIARAIDGTTDTDTRRAVLRAFKEGTIQVLWNCGVLTEGFDEPSVSCLLMARPTKIRGLYMQMLGRGTRLHPGKHNLLVLDVTGKSIKHKLVTPEELLGLPEESMTAEKTAKAVKAELDEAEAAVAEAQRTLAEQRRLARLRAQEENLFAELDWLDGAGGGFLLTLPTGTLRLHPVGDDKYQILMLRPKGEPELLHEALPLNYAQGVAEDLIKQNGWQALTSTKAAWRNTFDMATEKQEAFAARLGITFPAGTTKGQASDLISRAIAIRDDQRAAAAKPQPRPVQQPQGGHLLDEAQPHPLNRPGTPWRPAANNLPKLPYEV